MRLHKIFDRLLPSFWHVVVVLLVAAVTATPEMQAQEPTPSTTESTAPGPSPSPLILINRIEVPQTVRRGEPFSVAIHFHLDREVESPALLKSALHVPNGMKVTDEPSFRREERCYSNCPSNIPMTAGDWIATYQVSVNKKATLGFTALDGSLFVPSISSERELFSHSFSVLAAPPNHHSDLWWEIPLAIIEIPLVIVLLPLAPLVIVLACAGHSTCES